MLATETHGTTRKNAIAKPVRGQLVKRGGCGCDLWEPCTQPWSWKAIMRVSHLGPRDTVLLRRDAPKVVTRAVGRISIPIKAQAPHKHVE